MAKSTPRRGRPRKGAPTSKTADSTLETKVSAYRIPPDVVAALDARVRAVNASHDLPGRATRTGVLVQILCGKAAPLTEELKALAAVPAGSGDAD